jgi:hypothetical protein
MKRSDNIAKSTPPMQGRTRHSVHLHLAVYELEKDQKTRKRRKDHCLVMKSRKQRELNVQLVRQGYRVYGGEHQEVYPGMPCARIAGESPAEAVVDDSADYRKYGVISFTKSEDSKKPEKIENKAKKQKVSQCRGYNADDSSEIQVLQPHLFRSHTSYPLARGVGKWSQRVPWPGARRVLSRFIPVRIPWRATLTTVCYGIAPQDMGADWECDLCANTHLEEAHLVSRSLD